MPSDVNEGWSDRRHLLASCTAVASASGGVCGVRTISDTEQRVLDRIIDELEHKRTPSPSGAVWAGLEKEER
jgi:hypothetical protein